LDGAGQSVVVIDQSRCGINYPAFSRECGGTFRREVHAAFAKNDSNRSLQRLFPINSPCSCIKKMAKGLKSLMSVGLISKEPSDFCSNGIY
jgi:hypothetical protein